MEYASLKIEIEGASFESAIVQLLNDKKEVLEEIKLGVDQALDFDYLSPGKYKLKMIFDSNNNGKWDPGAYSPRKQPERVIFFSGEFVLRSLIYFLILLVFI